MRNIVIIIIISSIGMLSCVKNDNNLLGLLPAKTIVNPDTKLLLGSLDSKLLDVQIKEGGLIKGITDSYIFSTTDNFRSFNYSPHQIPYFREQLKIDGDFMTHVEINNFQFEITYSIDYGQSWQSFMLDLEGGIPDFMYSDMYATDIKLVDGNTALITIGTRQSSIYYNFYDFKTWLYRVNLSTHKGQFISSIEGYNPASMHFYGNRMWLILNKFTDRGNSYYDFLNGYVSHSDDGGVSWSEPVLIYNDGIVRMTAGSENVLFAFSPQRSAHYSKDGGRTWSTSNIEDPRFLNAEFGDANTIFAGTDHVVYKSSDAGANWTPYNDIVVSSYVYGTARSLNSTTGIVFNEAELFITEDGGNTWGILLSKKLK